jgi:tRNA (guanosine-2'-O-)-methyltransferase
MENSKLTEYLAGFLTEKRKQKIEEVLEGRTRHITVALENIFHSPNASAIVRTCECFGIQDMHFIREEKDCKINADVVQGASKWVSINDYQATGECVSKLKDNGYSIVATTLREGENIMPESLPVDRKLALFFGAEETGLSDKLHDAADYFVKIPMRGFTQSFNISVSAALLLQVLAKKMEANGIETGLSEKEKAELRLQWHKNSIKNIEAILKRYYTNCNLKDSNDKKNYEN